MPLTKTGKKVMAAMKDEYGEEKGEEVFYASRNKGNPGSEKWEQKGVRKVGEARGGRRQPPGVRRGDAAGTRRA